MPKLSLGHLHIIRIPKREMKPKGTLGQWNSVPMLRIHCPGVISQNELCQREENRRKKQVFRQ